MTFTAILTAFEQAATAGDTQRFAALFAADGRYDDGFFGAHHGRAEIAAMLERFRVGGERFAWQFIEPVCDGPIGYARYCFSYVSKEPESAGQLVVFEGIARFRLEAGLIADYHEVFDRGLAFVQLGYAGERVVKLLKRYADERRASPEVQQHLVWREQAGRTLG
ncbi:MAG: nuclear transport factor 2 family protein [Betaproteobacteria bacterium]|nr:nuclear transport factor 2 family protein [Betaproteobacteria bacterium]MCC6250314.1 nuclear transport factor 2 family protein [Rubrivivax sp.]MCL4696260.1 nuclear transport factor 2 family protein [Burkholderiaceae bacterium]